MLKFAVALAMMTTLGNAAPAPSSNLDASPPPATPPTQFTQPGPPADSTIQHGVVDPRGTDAQPLAVRVVALPAAGLPHAEEPPPGPSPSDTGGLAWIVAAFGALQSLLMIGLIYFVMQMANATRRMADAAERNRPAPPAL
jgi:hypothetical protein